METIKKLFDLGYTIDEFHDDLKPALTAVGAWAIIRYKQPEPFTMETFKHDAATAIGIVAYRMLVSFTMRTKVPTVVDLEKKVEATTQQVEVNKENISAR